jgi:hypothetical protein
MGRGRLAKLPLPIYQGRRSLSTPYRLKPLARFAHRSAAALVGIGQRGYGEASFVRDLIQSRFYWHAALDIGTYTFAG